MSSAVRRPANLGPRAPAPARPSMQVQLLPTVDASLKAPKDHTVSVNLSTQKLQVKAQQRLTVVIIATNAAIAVSCNPGSSRLAQVSPPGNVDV